MNATNPTPPTPAQPIDPAVEHASTRERILKVAGWLTYGALRHEVVEAAMSNWNVSRRTAQVYVQKAARRIAKLAEYDDPAFALKLSQSQRDTLFQQLQTLQMNRVNLSTPELRGLILTIKTQLRVLESRDRAAAKILELEAKYGRAEARRRVLPPVETASPTAVEASPPEPAKRCPAHPEIMRSAAQVTRAAKPVAEPNHMEHKEMECDAATMPAPAPRVKNCALATADVQYPVMT